MAEVAIDWGSARVTPGLDGAYTMEVELTADPTNAWVAIFMKQLGARDPHSAWLLEPTLSRVLKVTGIESGTAEAVAEVLDTMAAHANAELARRSDRSREELAAHNDLARSEEAASAIQETLRRRT